MHRFNRRSNTGVYYVPDDGFVDPTAPTAAEITAGQPLHDALAASSGFTSEDEDLPVPDLGSSWGKTIPGGKTAAASSLTFWSGDDDADLEEVIRAALPEGDAGYIVWSKRTRVPVAADPVDVFPVRIKSTNEQYGVENAGAQFMTGFSLYEEPDKDVAVAAP